MAEIIKIEHGTLNYGENGITYGDSDAITLYDGVLDIVYLTVCPRCHEVVEAKDKTCKHCDFHFGKRCVCGTVLINGHCPNPACEYN